jgi:crotonobetainyl-CoA:carnitine CoA-transferase CaiB-like acyl-CoA transferase
MVPGADPSAVRRPPLAGVTVLDLTRLLPGGYCTLLLSDLGADVIKVEEPGRGDYIRWTPPLVDGESAAHRALNRGKRSITLNLKTPKGPDVLRRLAGAADVVVESFRPGVMHRLGVGYEALAASNPALVYCSITGYGQDGPYRNEVGHDINYLGYAGALSMTGSPEDDERRPVVPGLQIGDLGGGGMLGAIGILAGLLDARQGGRGRFVDAAMLDGAVSWLSIHAGAALASGIEPDPATALLGGGWACYRVYRCRDGRWVTVGALEPRFWEALCRTLGCPDLIPEQFEPHPRQGEIVARLEGLFTQRDREGWLAAFAGVDACVGPVNAVREALSDPQVLYRGMLAEVAGASVGPGPVPKLSGGSVEPLTRAPGLGEHTDQVLREFGIADDEAAALRGSGVL